MGYLVKHITKEIKRWGGQTTRPIDTLYIGGGSPSLLTPDELNAIMSAVKNSFAILEDAEITVEVNPDDNLQEFFSAAKALGVNRISIGIQSADDDELALLGRRHNFTQAVAAVDAAKKAGFKNISADIMIGLPHSSPSTLKRNVEGILSLGTQHISAYILKVEEGTPFYNMDISLPDEDEVADQYLEMCRILEAAGMNHYEISNFARTGFESRHNNRYWLLEDYIGIGPAAHSFFEGQRYYYPADIKAFSDGARPVSDGEGGDEQEFIMLALRLSRGLIFSEYKDRFGKDIDPTILKKARIFEKQGLCLCDDRHISLTNEGMLVSNTIIGEFI